MPFQFGARQSDCVWGQVCLGPGIVKLGPQVVKLGLGLAVCAMGPGHAVSGCQFGARQSDFAEEAGWGPGWGQAMQVGARQCRLGPGNAGWGQAMQVGARLTCRLPASDALAEVKRISAA
jgi:hypothetical protein